MKLRGYTAVLEYVVGIAAENVEEAQVLLDRHVRELNEHKGLFVKVREGLFDDLGEITMDDAREESVAVQGET